MHTWLHAFLPSVALCCALLLATSAECARGADAFSITPLRTEAGRMLSEDFSVDESFVSHLPILVLDPAEGGAADEEWPGRLAVYDRDGDANSLEDAPRVVLDVFVRERSGDSPLGKKSRSLELAGGSSSDPVSLAGLPAGGEWFLHGSTRDKGMLRNGVAYELGRLIMPDATPRTRYCEVLVKRDGAYYYEGIHILSESVERLYWELALKGGSPMQLQFSPGQSRRGGNMVRTGSRIFTVVQASQDNVLSEEARRSIVVELEKIESTLYAIKPDVFLGYAKLLDENSAVDLYILDALMLSAFESSVSYRLCKGADGRIRFLPEWEYDTALDNASRRRNPLPFETGPVRVPPLSVLAKRLPVWRTLESGGDIRDLRFYPVYQAMGGENFLWFDRLFLSRSFLNTLYARYRELRRAELSPDRVYAVVDDLGRKLDVALERDWYRWRAEYTSTSGPYALLPFVDSQGKRHIRQTWSFDQELVKIAHCLREQDGFLVKQMGELAWMTGELYDKTRGGSRQSTYALICLFGMLGLMHVLSRRLG